MLQACKISIIYVIKGKKVIEKKNLPIFGNFRNCCNDKDLL